MADGSNNITQKERIQIAATNNSSNPNLITDTRSGSIIKLDKNNLKIKYVTEQNSSKKVMDSEDEALKFKSISNNDSAGQGNRNKVTNIVSSI